MSAEKIKHSWVGSNATFPSLSQGVNSAAELVSAVGVFSRLIENNLSTISRHEFQPALSFGAK